MFAAPKSFAFCEADRVRPFFSKILFTAGIDNQNKKDCDSRKSLKKCGCGAPFSIAVSILRFALGALKNAIKHQT